MYLPGTSIGGSRGLRMHSLVLLPCSCMHFCCSDWRFTKLVRCWVVVQLLFQHGDDLFDHICCTWNKVFIHHVSLTLAS